MIDIAFERIEADTYRITYKRGDEYLTVAEQYNPFGEYYAKLGLFALTRRPLYMSEIDHKELDRFLFL